MILYGKQYLKYFRYGQSMRDQSECPLPPLSFPYLKHLQVIDPSFVTIFFIYIYINIDIQYTTIN